MSRLALALTCSVLLPAVAQAQLQKLSPSPVTSPVREAGVYHLATGTWSRGTGASALAGPEVIYDNTCTVGYYVGLQEGAIIYDSGRMPSTSSPASATSLAGVHDAYEVNGFTIGYCTFEPVATSLGVSFVDCYEACDDPNSLPTPLVTFSIVNAPGGPAAGGQGCWIITVDLSNTTETFLLQGDCNGTYDNVGSTDSFGWSWSQTIPTTGSAAGPLFAGDPAGLFPQSGQTCGGIGAGTTFIGAGAGPGTGIDIIDQMEGDFSPSYNGCFWFGGYGGAGGNPFTAFYLQVQGDLGFVEPCNPGTAYCFGDGSGAACPCANSGGAGAGCRNSSGAGVILSGAGCPSFSSDTLSLSVSGVNGIKPGLLLRGNNQVNGGFGNGAGDGLICAAGGSQRSQVQMTDASGSTLFNAWNAAGLGSVANVGTATNFQFWYRDPVSGPCNSGFNFSNALAVMYQP